MKKIVFCLLFLTGAALGKTAWITDDLRTGVQTTPEDASIINATLVAGSSVEQLGVSKDGRYVHIKKGNIDGWVLAHDVSETPSIRANYNALLTQVETLKTQLKNAQTQNAQLAGDTSGLNAALTQAQAEANKAKEALLSLKRASENVVNIDNLNRKLQTQVALLEQNNLQLSQQNVQLKNNQDKQQMITGGLLVLGGMTLFWLLSLLGTGRSRRSSFDDL